MDNHTTHGNGNSSEDWGVFEVLCGHNKNNMNNHACCEGKLPDCRSSFDVVTTLRTELGALTYKRDRLQSELADVKGNLSAKELECENLRAQAARQTALIASLQNRLDIAEKREESVQSRCENTIQTIRQEKRQSEERQRQMLLKVQQLESTINNEKAEKENVQQQMNNLMRCLSNVLGLSDCESRQPTIECLVSRADEIMTELQRTKAKIHATCNTLSSCESELLSLKSLANIEKQRLTCALESAQSHNNELEARIRQHERDLQLRQDRLLENEICAEKLKEELRGLESRCFRIQNKLDRVQGDRIQFLRSLAHELKLSEPCETLIKDKLHEILRQNHNAQNEINCLKEQIKIAHEKLKEAQESTQCKLLSEEAQKCELEQRLEKCHAEIHDLRKDHLSLLEYLKRLANILNWTDCFGSADTHAVAESLLQRVENLVLICENHGFTLNSFHHSHLHLKDSADLIYHANNSSKLRRERSCHDLSVKENSSVYNLQKRIRILREQIQKRDLHLELLKKKLATIEDGTRNVCALQNERDAAICRAKKASKQVDKLTAELLETREQIAITKSQLSESIEYKIAALERARKIDELTESNCKLLEEKKRLTEQICVLKDRLKSIDECNERQRCHDLNEIDSLKKNVQRVQSQLTEVNCRLSHLQSFRNSVAHELNLHDMPETDLLQRLQALCSAHREFQMISKHVDNTSPCQRYEHHDDDDDDDNDSISHRLQHLSPSPTQLRLDKHTHHCNRHKSRKSSNDKRHHSDCFNLDVHRHHQYQHPHHRQHQHLDEKHNNINDMHCKRK